MGVDCSCMRTDLLEEKTIIILDAHHVQYKDHALCANITNQSDRNANSETLENTDASTLMMTSLCRRFLVKKSSENPKDFFSLAQESFSDLTPPFITFIERILSPINIELPTCTFILAPTEYYQGNFDQLLRKSGFAAQLLNDEKYIGYFVKGKREGYGRLIKSNGSVYEGDFKSGSLEGEGMCLEDGINYKGLFKAGLRCGKGREEWPDKSVYEGEFLNNMKHGKGKFEWSNGNKFSGMFKYGEICGRGKFRWKDGKTYKGSWKDNKMHGDGVFSWPDGKVYEGQYENDVKQGNGKLVWPDGREYEGGWNAGLQHGEGEYRWFNKVKGMQEARKGVWEAGNRVQWTS